MNPIIPIDASFIEDAMAYVGQLWADLNLAILLVIGIPLGFWILTKFVGFVRRQTSTGGRRGA
jgi:hypothetical protein